MKKFSALLLTFIIALMLLTGCGNALYDDLENFVNTEMAEINANYDEIKAEAGTWEDLDDYTDLADSLENVLIPLVDDSLEKLTEISPETEEVTELKNKYVDVMTAYKEAFEEILVGIHELDDDKILSGSDKLDTAIELLDEYNKTMEDLAEEVGASIEY